MPRAALPGPRLLVDLYVRQDLTYRQIADRYGCTPRTVQSHLEKAATALGLSWPLKSPAKARAGRTGSVPTLLLRAEIVHCIQTYRVTQVQLAEACGMPVNHLHQITSGHRRRVQLSTARKIQRGIEAVEAGKVAPATTPVTLPKHIRTHCPSNHPYGKRRDSDGRRVCSVCRAMKDARSTERKRQPAV